MIVSVCSDLLCLCHRALRNDAIHPSVCHSVCLSHAPRAKTVPFAIWLL